MSDWFHGHGELLMMEESIHWIAVLDVLGFKELIGRGSVAHLAERLDDLVESVPRVAGRWSTGDIHCTVQLEKLLFSDTILLWSKASLDPQFESLEVCSFLQGVSYVLYAALLQGFPLRAGVAYGPVVIDPERGIALGQPIIDAYLTESAQEWIGGAIHDSCPPCAMGFDQEYKVPVKRRAQIRPQRALNWTMHARIPPIYEWSGTREVIDDAVFKALQEGLENASSLAAKKKYKNTLKYVEGWHATLSGIPWTI